MFMAAELQLRQVLGDFVRLYERLSPDDDPGTKPNYSYSELVFLAILRSPNFCLPIGEIYKYIQSRFSFFRTSSRQHWKNAVRHSLSKTKCFSKISVGRGVAVTKKLHKATYLWCLVPSSIISFARGDYRPSSDRGSGVNTLQYGYYSVNAGQFWGQVAIYLEKKMAGFRGSLSRCNQPGEIFEEQLCEIPRHEEACQRGNFFDARNLEMNAISMPKTGTVSIEEDHNKQPETQIPGNIDESQSSKTEHLIDDRSNNSSGTRDDSGIVSDLFVSNTSSDLSLTDANIIEHSLNLLSRSDLTHTSSPITNVLYTGVNDYQDDRKTPELPDLRNVSPLNLSPILSGESSEMSPQFLKVPMNAAYSTPESYRMAPAYTAAVMSQSSTFYHSSPYTYPALTEETGFPFGLPPLYQYGFLTDSGGSQEYCL